MSTSETYKVEDFLTSFAGPKSTSLNVAFPILIFLSIGSLLTESIVSGASVFDLIKVISLALIFSLFYFFIFSNIVNRFTAEASVVRVVCLVVLYFTTEMIRALFIGWELIEQNLNFQIDWDYRIAAGGLTGILFFGLRSVVFNDSHKYKFNLNQFQATQDQLRKLSKLTQNDLDINKKRIIESIQLVVSDALRDVIDQQNITPGNSKLISAELMRVSEEVVRPISQDLFEERIYSTDDDVDTTSNFSLTKLLKLATVVQPFHPIAITGFGLIQLFGVAIFLTNNLVNATLTMFAFTTWIFMILFIAKEYIQPRLYKVNLFFRILIINFVYLLLTMFLFIDARLPKNLMFPEGTQTLIYVVLIGLIIPWSFAIYSAIQFARLETLQSIRDINEKLNWSNARLGAKLWADQKKLASLVHRDIQGALISTALKFKRDVESGIEPNLATNQIRDLIASTSVMVNSDEQISPPKSEIENLNNLWEGIFRISLEISDETYTKILNDSVCLQTVNDFIGEFATNSVKHGKASIGEVKIELIEENVLKIIMINNGLPLAENLTHGLGSQMVLRQSLSIVHENLSDGGVYFAATIPIS